MRKTPTAIPQRRLDIGVNRISNIQLQDREYIEFVCIKYITENGTHVHFARERAWEYVCVLRRDDKQGDGNNYVGRSLVSPQQQYRRGFR